MEVAKQSKETFDDKLKKVTGLVSQMSALKDCNLKLAKSYSSKDKEEIPKKAFLGIQIGDTIHLNEDATCYGVCIFEDMEMLKFVIVAEKYSVVNVHSHDFKESLKMMEGRIRETISNQVLLPGTHIIFEPTKEHGFISEDFSMYAIKVHLT